MLAILILVMLVISMGYFIMRGPDLDKYECLKHPQITTMPNHKMLVVEAAGDPNFAGAKAFATLYKTYFMLKNNHHKTIFQIAPRARWPKDLNTPKKNWLGRYALPVSDTAQLPDNYKSSDPNQKVELQNWEYGEVAEILHVGPYSAEIPTTEKLQKFIKERGYRVVGEHEEEYLKGPGIFGPGDPAKYYTIIRYRIAK